MNEEVMNLFIKVMEEYDLGTPRRFEFGDTGQCGLCFGSMQKIAKLFLYTIKYISDNKINIDWDLNEFGIRSHHNPKDHDFNHYDYILCRPYGDRFRI